MEMLGKIRRMHLRDKLSLHEIARRTGLSRNTIRSWLRKPEPKAAPEYRRRPGATKLTPFHDAIIQALKADAHRPRHERRTAKALLAQIRAAGYGGCYAQLTKFIREWREQEGKAPNAFVPLQFELGEAFQFDWSEEGLVIGGVYRKLQVAHMKLCASRAFWLVAYPSQGNRNVKQVVLAIDSPGGAPVEAERISHAITILRMKHPKPVIAAISNLGASAAYMIALHTDRIVAGKYSLVGSIGAIIAPWQLNRAMDKAGITQRVYASGKLKSFLNPFIPISAEAESKAQELVNRAGRTFLAELVETRGRRLKAGVDYGTGEVWSGTEAKELGLVDTIGTLDDVTTTKGIRTYDFGPRASAGSLLGRSMANALVGQALERMGMATPRLR